MEKTLKELEVEEKQLVKERKKIGDRLYKIQNILRKEKSKKYLNRYYKYENSYGASDSRPWFIYLFTNKLNDHGDVYGITFEVTCHEEIRIDKEHQFYEGSWIEIKKEEYDEAWKKTLLRINTLFNK